ncbi:MAG: hypothetical protein HXY34_06895 [Candidatus Thorarchaeota archaeon]|nr:hypothetical protein [Candidatus Thorarchaeota archaeon]
MQSPELIPLLAVSSFWSLVTMVVIARSWWKTRLLPTLLYSIAIACFSGMALDLLLDQFWIPFRDWELYIGVKRLWWSNVLLAIFVVTGFLCWYFAIMYSQYETPPRSSMLVVFLVGAALVSEIMKEDWSSNIPLLIEAAAFSIIIVEILRYARRVLPTVTDADRRLVVRLYFLGFMVWILAAPLGVILGNIGPEFDWAAFSWPIPYSAGLFMISIAVSRNPRLLFISKARPMDLIVLDKDGVLLFSYRFVESSASVDPELMGSAMSGILSLIREMLSSQKQVHRIDHGDAKILVESGPMTTFLLIVTEETARFRQSLRNLQLEFEANYREELTSSPSVTSAFSDFKWRAREVFL